MQPRIVERGAGLFVGMRQRMSLADDRTGELWRRFGPRLRAISDRVSEDVVSMQSYGASPPPERDPTEPFEKWACVQVDSSASVPEGLEGYRLDGGLYAVFTHVGPATDLSTFGYIYGEWLGASGYELDEREHFEVLPPGYDPTDPNATEEIWIPIRRGARESDDVGTGDA